MIVACLALVLAGELAAACREPPPPPPGGADRQAAARYARVGDAERAAGDPLTAAIAYGKALALDPAHGEARRAFAALCAGAPDAEAPQALLGRGIARYEEGRWQEAEGLLERAAHAPAAETAAGARFFLGMIHLGRGDGAAAADAFERAAAEPAYRPSAEPMRRLAARNRRVSLLLLAQPEYDTNPHLLPEQPPTPAAGARARPDFDLLGLGALAARPWPWLALRNTLFARKQHTATDLDLVGDNAQLAWQTLPGRHAVGARYDLDLLWLGGAPYLRAHQGTLEYRLRLGGSTLAARYALRRRDFLRAEAAGFTGYVHAGALEAARALGRSGVASAGLVGVRELTATPAFSHAGLGAQVRLGWRRWRMRWGLRAAALGARHDDVDAASGRRRDDLRLDGGVELELDLGDHLALLGGLDATQSLSTAPDFRYRKLVARLGLATYLGWL